MVCFNCLQVAFFADNYSVGKNEFACKNAIYKEENMAQLSEKELSGIKDLLTEEELLVKKFKMLAEHATEPELKKQMLDISAKHQ